MQTISTQYGDLIPQYTDDDLRKREILPVEYHPSGALKAVPLETQTIIATPAGDIPAELISFHENGTISRIFPLNGKLSGYWSQEDEAGAGRVADPDHALRPGPGANPVRQLPRQPGHAQPDPVARRDRLGAPPRPVRWKRASA